MEEGQGLEFDAEAFGNSIRSWKCTCCLAAKTARCSYQRALHLSPWQANIYADIAVTSDLIYSLDNTTGHDFSAWYDLVYSFNHLIQPGIALLIYCPFSYQAASGEDGFGSLVTRG